MGQKHYSLDKIQKENAFILWSTPKTWNSMNCRIVN